MAVKKCYECGEEIKDKEKVLITESGSGYCSKCYVAKPYTAYVYEDKYGNFVGTSEIAIEKQYDKEFDDFY